MRSVLSDIYRRGSHDRVQLEIHVEESKWNNQEHLEWLVYLIIFLLTICCTWICALAKVHDIFLLLQVLFLENQSSAKMFPALSQVLILLFSFF